MIFHTTGTKIIFVTLAALCWGLSGGIGGILMASGWAPCTVAFYQGAIGLLMFLTWLMLSPLDSGLKNYKLWCWSAIAGVAVAGNFSFYFVSVAHCSIAVAATLMYSSPVLIYLLSFALKLEIPTTLRLAAIAMVVFGIILLTRIYDIGEESVTLFGAGVGLLAGFSYAIFIFGFKFAAHHGSPQAVLSIAFAVLTIILIWPANVVLNVKILSSPEWPWVVLVGVLAGLSFFLYLIGLNHTGPALASIVAMIEPVTASLFGVVVLNESLMASQIIGMSLIIIVTTALSVYLSTE